jgi:hypothetical protein
LDEDIIHIIWIEAFATLAFNAERLAQGFPIQENMDLRGHRVDVPRRVLQWEEIKAEV